MATNETELCFYAKVTRPEGYKEAADIEEHEQWEFKPLVKVDGSSRGKMRVRKTTRNGASKFEQTIKLPSGEGGAATGMTEFNTVIDEEVFEAWKKAFGEKGYIKTRYTFISKNVELDYDGRTIKLPEIKYEIDAFYNQKGQRGKWVKIDIEIDHLLDYLDDQHPDLGKFGLSVKLSSLPLGLEDAISAVTKNAEECSAISTFWDTFAHKEIS